MSVPNYLEIARRVMRELELEKMQAQSAAPIALPAAVRLVKWETKRAPILITRCSVVTDVDGFAAVLLGRLELALKGESNWSVREIVETLEQIGVHVEVETQGTDNATSL